MTYHINLSRALQEQLEAERKLPFDGWRVTRKQITPALDGSWGMEARVADWFYYISHVSITVDADGSVTSCRCDCRCEEAFCRHIRMALLSQEVEIMDAPEAPVVPEETETIEIPEEPELPEEPEDAELPEEPEETELPDAPVELLPETVDSLLSMLSDEEEAAEEEPPEEESIEEPEFTGDPRTMQIQFGTDMESGEPVFWYPNDTEKVFHTNTGIIGTMGTGKTQFTKSLITQLHRSRVNNYDGYPFGMLIFDFKGDYNETKQDFVRAAGAKILKPYDIPYNPFALHTGGNVKPLLPVHAANTFKQTIARSFRLGAKQDQLLLECIIEAYHRQGIQDDKPSTWSRPAPTFEQVYQVFAEATEGRTPDSLTAAMNKIHQFRIFRADPLRAEPLSNFLHGVTVLDLSGYDADIQTLVLAITLDQFYMYMVGCGSSKTDGRYRQLTNLILVDEADSFMKQQHEALGNILRQGREFGVGVILSTQSLTHFKRNISRDSDEKYADTILTWVVHNVGDLKQNDVETVFKLPEKAKETGEIYDAIKGLQKHESITRTSRDNPIVIKDLPFWQLMQE